MPLVSISRLCFLTVVPKRVDTQLKHDTALPTPPASQVVPASHVMTDAHAENTIPKGLGMGDIDIDLLKGDSLLTFVVCSILHARPASPCLSAIVDSPDRLSGDEVDGPRSRDNLFSKYA